jgi:nitrite reductase/ring-hydroxylating ferredoxin subunit
MEKRDYLWDFTYYFSIFLVVLSIFLKYSVISIQSIPVLAETWSWVLENTTETTLFLYCILPYVIYRVYKLLFKRYIYSRKLNELPDPPPVYSNRIRFSGNTPPPFPNGWFMLCESNELKKGQVIRKQALGKEFAVFRGEDGVVRVMAGFCPHLGAHLGVCGKVKKNCLVCPFHGWTFNGEGKVRISLNKTLS